MSWAQLDGAGVARQHAGPLGSWQQHGDLHGRAYELERLSSIFSRPAGTVELLTVFGSVGTGKSRLLEEFQLDRGLDSTVHVACRFSRHEAPEAVLAGALVRLRESRVLLDERLALEIEALVEDAGTAIWPRLRSALFALCAAHRVVLTLDDGQFAGSDVLKLLADLIEELEGGGRDHMSLAVVMAAGEDATRPALSVRALEHDCAALGVRTTCLELAGLDEAAVAMLIGSQLPLGREACEVLALPITRLSQGVPGLVLEVLEELCSEGLVRPEDGHWMFRDGEIEDFEMAFCDPARAQELLTGLTDGAMEALEALSILPRQFTRDEVLPCCSKPGVLEELRRVGALRLLGSKPSETYRFDSERLRNLLSQHLIPERAQPAHLRMYELCQQRYEQSGELFWLSQALHHALSLRPGSDLEDLSQMGSLCRVGAKRSMVLGTFEVGARYASLAVELMQSNPQTPQRALFSSRLLRLRLLMLAKDDSDRLQQCVDEIRGQARGPDQESKVLALEIDFLLREGRVETAIDRVTSALDGLGVDLEAECFTPPSPRVLRSLPQLSAESDLAALRLLRILMPLCLLHRPAIHRATTLAFFRFASRGTSAYLPVAMVAYARLLASADREFQEGLNWGRLALELASEPSMDGFQSQVRAIYYTSLHFWRAPLIECIVGLRRNLKSALARG